MARTLSSVSAVVAGTTRADLTLAYTGTYDGGNNSVECGGGSGEVRTDIYKRDVTAGGAFVYVTTQAGGTTGATSYTVTGLTDGVTYEFRANSYQRRRVWNAGDMVCEDQDTGLSGNFTSNQISTPLARVTCDVGAFTLSGQAVGLKAGRNLSAAVGAFALSGQAVTLIRGRTLPAGAGAYVLTGQAATLRADRRLALDAASYTLTGSDAALRFGYSMSVGAGEFALTGNPVRWMFWDKADPSDTAWSAASEGSTDWTPIAGGSTAWTQIVP